MTLDGVINNGGAGFRPSTILLPEKGSSVLQGDIALRLGFKTLECLRPSFAYIMTSSPFTSSQVEPALAPATTLSRNDIQ